MTEITGRLIDAAHWWRAPWALERLLADLSDAEARLLRPGGPWPPHLDPIEVAAASPGESGLGFDSLERIGLAAAFSQALHLHQGGLADDLLTSPTLAGWLQAATAALDRSGMYVTVHSSGSSGKQRSLTHATSYLASEAAFWARLLSDRRRVCTAVASHHIYGLLFNLMLPAELGLPIVDLRARSPGGVLATLRPGDVVIGHPVFWSALLRVAPVGWPTDIVGITSGAACAGEMAIALVDAGLTRVLDIYGSSETAGIGWRERASEGWTDGRGSHRLLPWWCQIAGGLISADDQAPVLPPDHLDWDDFGGFGIGKRRDGAVMIGGLAVDLDHVRSTICAHPGVADASVRPMRVDEGVRLKAFVIPRQEAAGDLTALLTSVVAHIDAALTVAERPRAVRFGLALPLTASGKPADWPAC